MAKLEKERPVTIKLSQEKPSESDSSGAIKEIGKGAFAKIPREIDEESLKNPIVGRLLLSERDRLLSEKAVLENYRDSYHEADKRTAVLEEKSRSEDKFKTLSTSTLAIGGILIGIAFAVNDPAARNTLIFLGLILIIISVVITYKK